MFNPLTQPLFEGVTEMTEQAQPLRLWLEQPENVEHRNELALALLDECLDMHREREHYEDPLYRYLIVAWWRLYLALPWAEANAVAKAVDLNNAYLPCWAD